MRGKFETTLKMHQMCFVHATPEEFKIATITGYFGFVLGGKLWHHVVS